jgi:hypothetical protein
MVPFTIFQRLSSLGSGGGVKAGKIPSRIWTIEDALRLCFCFLLLVYLSFTWGAEDEP